MAAQRSSTALRAVKPGEKAAPRPRTAKAAPKTVTQAAADGSTRELLVALRARVATSVQDPTTPARDLAALTRRLQDIVKEIEAIDLREKQDLEAKANEADIDESFDASAV